MAFTQVFRQSLITPEEQWSDDTGITTTGDTITSVNGVVNANGGGANALAIAWPAAGFQSLGLVATVPCVVTFTTSVLIDGVSATTITLVANVIKRVGAMTGDITAVSVGANTDVAGLAGTIKISVLFNS